MMQELVPYQFESVRPLFQGFDYSLSLAAAIAGNNPGRIFVDDVIQPQTALALTVEGYLLAGAHDNASTNAALRRLLREKIFTGEVYVNGDWSMSLAVDPEAWESRLPELIPTHEAEKLKRTHYLCRQLKFDWRQHVPAGCSVRRVDRAVLDALPEEMREWMEIDQVWGSVENFLEKGVSFAVFNEQEMVAWCTPDCVAGDQIDVGIMTHPAQRRRGLASVAVAATVDHCLNHGYKAVGWHCNTENVGSWKTAEKVGFERHREYTYYYYMYDLVDHLAELGWYFYRQGEYAKTVRYYEQVFAQRDQNPDYYYHLVASAWALLGDREKSLYFLAEAVEHGWTHAEFTKEQEEFSILHEMPEWDALWARVEEN